MYKERDEDKAERNFKNSKSVSAAYKGSTSQDRLAGAKRKAKA